MKTYIAILRGINVSGHNIIKMASLKKMFEDINFADVQTYIQSGNVVFRAEESDADILGEKISAAIMKTFKMTVPVIVLDSKTLKKIIKDNPFLADGKSESKFLYVTILNGKPAKEKVESLYGMNSGADEIIVKGRSAYLCCPGGYGNTKLSNTLVEKKLGVSATTRNWKTICELASMAGRFEN